MNMETPIMLDQFMDFISENPLYAVIALLVTILILWSILKMLVRAVIVLLAVAVLCAGFLAYTGSDMPGAARNAIEEGRRKIIILKDRGLSLLPDSSAPADNDSHSNSSSSE